MKLYCGNCFQLGKYKEAEFLAAGSAYCDEHYVEAIKFAQEHQNQRKEVPAQQIQCKYCNAWIYPSMKENHFKLIHNIDEEEKK